MPMKCPEVRDCLSAMLDGELDPTVAALLARHLQLCAGCRRELAQLEALDRALAALPVATPPGLPQKVRDRLPRAPRRGWQSLALAASLVLGILLGGTLGRNFYPQPRENSAVSEAEVASLDAFSDFPQGSLGMVLASYQGDEVTGNNGK